jgi:hypothetical protein
MHPASYMPKTSSGTQSGIDIEGASNCSWNDEPDRLRSRSSDSGSDGPSLHTADTVSLACSDWNQERDSDEQGGTGVTGLKSHTDARYCSQWNCSLDDHL